MELLDKYSLEEPLGEGGMARVWRATDTVLKRPVAIKVLKLGLDPEGRERFLAEARVLSRLRSRHILELLDFGESGGSYYFVMPFLRAVCLADLMVARFRSGRHFSPAETIAIIAPIALALDEAHSLDLVHRDVKPHNILISPSGASYLTDFGIVRDMAADARLTQEGTVLGTPRYMAPEQLTGETIDSSTDLYALGLTMYELLAGRIPGEVQGDLPATLRKRIVGVREPIEGPVPEAAALSAVLEGVLAPRSQRTITVASAFSGFLSRLAPRGADLQPLRDDVRAILAGKGIAGAPADFTSPWTRLGQQALETPSATQPFTEPTERPGPPARAAEATPAVHSQEASVALAQTGTIAAGRPADSRPLVLPLVRPTRPAQPVAPRQEARPPWPATAVVAFAFLVAAAGAAMLLSPRSPPPPSVRRPVAIVGFHRIRIEWSGEARELSLVTPQGHEAIHGVRDREFWESSRLVEAGNYSATLLPMEGPPVPVGPFELTPFDAAALPIRFERNFDAVIAAIELPVPAEAEARAESENLSVARVSSPQARRHRLRIPIDPMEPSTLKIKFRSALNEESAAPVKLLPALQTAFQQAIAASTERLGNLPWKNWARRIADNRSPSIADAIRRDIAALELETPFRDLLPAVPAFLDSNRISFELKARLYDAVMRVQDPAYFCERHGVDVVSTVAASLPPTWCSTLQTAIPAAESLPLTLTGIMTFKPRFPGKLANYDFMDEISRVEEKEAILDLDAPVHRAEMMLETWALHPDLSFTVTVNQRISLQFRIRGRDSRAAIAARRTVPIFHRVDPTLLVRGPNRFKIAIRPVAGSEPTEIAALNSATLRVVWDGPPPSGHAPADLLRRYRALPASQKAIEPAPVPGKPGR